jgi:hypothetical protein
MHCMYSFFHAIVLQMWNELMVLKRLDGYEKVSTFYNFKPKKSESLKFKLIKFSFPFLMVFFWHLIDI